MSIKFINEFGGCNFGKMHGDFYKKNSVVEVVEDIKDFNPKTMISLEMATIALNNGYAQRVNTNNTYETKIIIPESNTITAEEKEKIAKEKRNTRDREKRALKKKKK